MIRFLIFISTSILLSVYSQFYLFKALHGALNRSCSHLSSKQNLLAFLVIFSLNFVLLAMTVGGLGFQQLDSAVRRLLSIGYFSVITGIIWIAMILYSTKLASAFFVRKSSQIDNTPLESQSSPQNLEGCSSQAIERRTFLKWTTAMGTVSALGIGGIGLAEAFGPYRKERYLISHPSLEGLDGSFTIAQISDIHYGWFIGDRQLAALVSELNAIEFDALFVTGDLFHARRNAVETAIPYLRQLRPRLWGNFVILGNHEYIVGYRRSTAALRESGLIHLADKWMSFKKDNAVVHIGGLDDALKHWDFENDWDIVSDFKDKMPTNFGLRLLLCHRPTILPLAQKAGLDYAFSGHVHGGQLLIPVPGTGYEITPARVKSVYTHGWYSEEKCSMYVNRGAGLIYVPWRINCPPEISLFSFQYGPNPSIVRA